MLEWWAGLSPWLRYGVALAFLLASTILFFCRIVWVWGWAIGGVLLILAFPSSAKRKGYHDF